MAGPLPRHWPLCVTIDVGSLTVQHETEVRVPMIACNFDDELKSNTFYNAVVDIRGYRCHEASCREINHCTDLDSVWQNSTSTISTEAKRIFGPKMSRQRVASSWLE